MTTINDILADLMPNETWWLDMLCWREDDCQWECHLMNIDIIYFGFGKSIEEAINNAITRSQGSFSRAQRPVAAPKPAPTDFADLFADLTPTPRETIVKKWRL